MIVFAEIIWRKQHRINYKAACWQLVEHRGPTFLSHYVFLKKYFFSNTLNTFPSSRNLGKQKGQDPKKITNLEKGIEQSLIKQPFDKNQSLPFKADSATTTLQQSPAEGFPLYAEQVTMLE